MPQTLLQASLNSQTDLIRLTPYHWQPCEKKWRNATLSNPKEVYEEFGKHFNELYPYICILQYVFILIN